jgi:hypothetical protein
MGYVVKYSGGSVSNARKKGNVALGVDADGYDKTSVSGFYAGVAPVPGFHNLVRTSATDDPDFYTLTDLELVNFANSLGGSVSDVDGAKVYLASRNDVMFTDEIPDDTEIDGLVLELDASNLSSYPGSGTTWYDLSGNGSNGTLLNGPVLDPKGYIDFDGSNDYVVFNAPIGSSTTVTVEMVCEIPSNYSNKMFFGWNGYDVWCSGGNLGYNTNNGDVHGISASTVSSLGLVNNWKHYVFEMRSDVSYTNNKIYVNGVAQTLSQRQNSENVGNRNFNSGTGQFPGYRSNATAYVMDYNVSYFKVYSRSLSQSEILQNYYSSDIVTDGLIFAVDAGNLVSYESGSTTAYNMTGSNDLSLKNGLEFNPNHGGYFDSDGTNDGLDTPDASNLDVTNNFTVEGWVWWNQHKNYGSLLVKGPGGSGQLFNYSFFFYESMIRVGFGDGSGYKSNSISVSNVPVNQWHHILGTYDGANLKFYVNGNLINTVAHTTTPYQNSDNLNVVQSAYPIDGRVAIARVYNKALTSEEVLQNYNSQKARFTNPDPTLEIDGEWLKVFRHYTADGDMFSNSNDWAEAKSTNTDNPQANKYSILDTVYRYKIDGKYTFKLNYPNEDITNIWSQTNNPVRDDGSGGVEGYQAISIGSSANSWGGLERRDSRSETFLDGSIYPSAASWWFAVGARSNYPSYPTIPGANTGITEVELWIKYK